MGVGAELEEIERNSLVRSVSWELDSETIDTAERNMYTHNGSWELRQNKATVNIEPCFVTVVDIVTSKLETRSLEHRAKTLETSLASININQRSSEA